MSEQPAAVARPAAGGKKILGVPRTTFFLAVGSAVVIGLAFYWWRNYQAGQQSATAASTGTTDTGNVDTSGELSTIQTELETLLEEEGATTTSSSGGTGWGSGGGWSGGTTSGGGSSSWGGGSSGSSGSGSSSSGSGSSSGSTGSSSSGPGVNGSGSPPVSTSTGSSTSAAASGTAVQAPKTSPPAIAAKVSGSSVVITWGSVGGATGYQVQVAEPGGTLVLNKNLTATSATIDVLPVRGTYDYKIRALNQNTPGPWSAVKQFTVVT
jgi:hypothetical protein